MAVLSRAFLARLAAGWLALALLAAGGFAAASTPIEREIKAAYLYKFGSYVEWPESSFSAPDSPIVVGIAGNDALAEQVTRIVAGRTIQGRAVTVRKLGRGDSAAGLHVLFAGGTDRAAIAELLASVRGQPVLTVSDAPNALELGSMVSFVIVGQKLRFEVALAPVAPSRLRISARMLAAALRVEGMS